MHPLSLVGSALVSTLILSGCSTLTTTTEAPWAPAEPVQITQSSSTSETNKPQEFNNVWDRILNRFALDLDVSDERVEAQRNWYIKHPDYMARVSKRAEPYLYYIAEQIDVRGIPGELALLPIVESAFDPFAYSHGRASGVWQFIPSTGIYFGLKQDWWYDGRRDIRAATNAALDYLTRLSGQFNGDWQLALASYNAGGGNIRKAVRKNKERGKPTDFWSLDLRSETSAYVPKLIALAQILKQPNHYGVTFTPIVNEPYFSVVQTGGQIDLSQVAELAEVDIEEVYRLNPGFNRWATDPEGPHEVLIPTESEERFASAIVSFPKQDRVKWNRYTVVTGDNLDELSKRFRTTPAVIRQANSLSGNTIRVGQSLIIPTAFKGKEAYTHSSSERLTRTRSARQPNNTHQARHTVRAGETLWAVSRNYGVTVRELAHWNGMAPGDPIHPGQHLTVWVKDKHLALASRSEIRQVNYSVRSGDSLSSIATRFKVSVANIRQWNPSIAETKYLMPGQPLTLYVNVVR